MTIVVLDAGHGGHDPGATNAGWKEKDMTLKAAKQIREMMKLKYPSVKVVMTRESDAYVSLQERCRIANQSQARLFLSIHVNDAVNAHASGYEDFIYNRLSTHGDTARMRNLFHQHIAPNLPIRNRGKKTADYQVLRDTSMPAILTEMAFIKGDLKFLKSNLFFTSFALSAADGIAAAVGAKQTVC